MSGLREALAGYLDLRHSLGFKLEREARLLEQFITYLDERGSGTVTVTDALAWVSLPPGASPGWLRFRMQAVRGFAAYLRTLDPATEVPPASLLPGGPRRAVPYLYSPADITALLTAEWLSRELCSTELRREQLRDAVIARCRAERLEPPTFGQIARLVNSAVRMFEERFCGVTEERLDTAAGVVGRLEQLIGLGEQDPGAAAGGGERFLYGERDKPWEAVLSWGSVPGGRGPGRRC
jgi:hypothetical protein